MVIDTLSRHARYHTLHPRFAEAFHFLLHTDLHALPIGRTHIDGDRLYINIDKLQGRVEADIPMETHRRYIDIQLPLTGIETIGWTPASALTQPLHSYDADKDIAFFSDPSQCLLRLAPGTMAIFFPDDAHRPGIAPLENIWHKAVVKILIE